MNIAVYGGTFDPPTVAHKAIIEKLAEQELFDEVWVMPSADRVDKPHMSPFIHRHKMVQAMAAEMVTHKVVVSEFEANLGTPTQTIRTYESLQNTYPSNTFWFVFGSDSYGDMHNWEGGKNLRKTMNVCVIPRIGYRTPHATDKRVVLPVVAAVEHQTSSTKVRELCHLHKDIGSEVVTSVKKYIQQHALYI